MREHIAASKQQSGRGVCKLHIATLSADAATGNHTVSGGNDGQTTGNTVSGGNHGTTTGSGKENIQSSAEA
jgi:hypothetical protein